MNKIFWATIIALLSNIVITPAFGQGFTVLDTIEHKGQSFELVRTSLDELGVNQEKDNYTDLVIKAMKKGLDPCPSDSLFLYRVSAMVELDWGANKFQNFVATAPYSQPGGETAFFIPTIVSTSDGNKVELYYERVGLFYPEEFPDPFLTIGKVLIPGYSSIDDGFTPYDWLFVRAVHNEPKP